MLWRADRAQLEKVLAKFTLQAGRSSIPAKVELRLALVYSTSGSVRFLWRFMNV